MINLVILNWMGKVGVHGRVLPGDTISVSSTLNVGIFVITGDIGCQSSLSLITETEP